MWHWITDNAALLINLHHAGIDRFTPRMFADVLEAWATNKVSKDTNV